MTGRIAESTRQTGETDIHVQINLDGQGIHSISTQIPFFDHMLTLFCVHGFFDLTVRATGDVDVDYHHTVEDVGLVLGAVMRQALGDRKGICRYGHAVLPMDETLTDVAIDLSGRPVLVYNAPVEGRRGHDFDTVLAKEFFRAVTNQLGMNLHINVRYGENEHHIIESMFKATARALRTGVALNRGMDRVLSTKGVL